MAQIYATAPAAWCYGRASGAALDGGGETASVLATVTSWAPELVAIALAMIASMPPVKLLKRFQ